jgi:hypothetical protein
LIEVPGDKTIHNVTPIIRHALSPTFDADGDSAFQLWKVQAAVPADHSHLLRTITNLNITNTEQLPPFTSLSGLFSAPLDSTNLHIVVKVHGHHGESAQRICLAQY